MGLTHLLHGDTLIRRPSVGRRVHGVGQGVEQWYGIQGHPRKLTLLPHRNPFSAVSNQVQCFPTMLNHLGNMAHPDVTI